MVALRLTQGFQLPTAYQGEGLTKGGDEYNDIEKARVVRQDGDIHPNGKWVWVSSAAGGKGDWRVIKKQKGDNPAPAAKSPKEEAKPAEGGTPKKSKLQDKIDGMSQDELEALQKMVAGAIAKKKPAAKEEKPAKEEKKKSYNVDNRGVPMDLTQLKEQTLKELLHSALGVINDVNRQLSLGVGKIKLKRLNETLENERGKFAELKEEADSRGLKFDYKEKEYENGKEKKKEETKPAAKKEVRDLDGDKIPEGFNYLKGKEGVYNWFLLHAGEAWQADLGAGDQVIVAYMPTEIQKQKSWPDDYAFFSADGNYATIRRRNGEKDEFEFFLEKEDALNAAQKLIDQSAGSDNSSQGDDDDDDEGYAVDPPSGFEHYDKYAARKNYAGLECEELWTNEDEYKEVIVARMTDAQKKETWPDEDFSGTGKYAVIYANEDVIDFYDNKDDAFDEAKELASKYEDDDEDDYDDGDLTEDIAKIVHKYEEGADVEEVDTYDFGDVFSDLRHTGEAYRIKDDYLGDLVIVPLYEQSFEHNKRVLGIKTDAKEGYALFVGNNQPEFYKTVEEAAKWAGEAIKDGYYEQNYDEDGNELAKPKPNKPKLGEAPMS